MKKSALPSPPFFLYNCARTPTGHTTVKQNPFGERLISTTILVSKKVFVTEILDN